MPVVRETTLEEIMHLRHAILRADTTLENALFAEDRLPTTHHVGAFADDGTCVGCATFLSVAHENEPAWQLRGMAVRAEVRKAGVGKQMLDFAELLLSSLSPMRLLWCHARVVAVPFYRRCGWTVVSEEYQIIGIPHLKMVRRF